MSARPGGRQKAQLRAAVLAEHGPRCWLCGGDVPLDVSSKSPLYLTLDHVVPVADGGLKKRGSGLDNGGGSWSASLVAATVRGPEVA